MRTGKNRREQQRDQADDDRLALQMTPMIDVVFLLLVFFLLTFKITVQEGDFEVRMPQHPSAGPIDHTLQPPIRVSLAATDRGDLQSISFGHKPVGNFQNLRQEVQAYLAAAAAVQSPAAETEVVIQCDFGLRYEYVIDAITAVTGYQKDGQLVQMIGKVRLEKQPAKLPID